MKRSDLERDLQREPTIQLSVRLPERSISQVDRIARELGVSRNRVISSVLALALDEMEAES